MPNTFIHGYKGKFLIGSTDFAVTDFNLDWEVDADDITHTGAGGSQVVLDGVERFEGTITFIYDTTNKPTVAPQQLKPRTFAVAHLKPDGTDDFSATVLCSKFSFKSGPKAGAVAVTVNVKSSSAITYPVS
ncbi:hypothetical protein V5E97_10155 [Singulisphaera sp. Ch08]|uniref:Uncharacterized protein n=1 Tax=Singulisphaera sp. Ch08 TaxID=3120278 RepID=A0AAU7CP46_9BACT